MGGRSSGMRRWVAEAQGVRALDLMPCHAPFAGENATDLGNSIRLRHGQRDLGRAYLGTGGM